MIKVIPETKKQKEQRLMMLSKKELVKLLCNSQELIRQISDAYNEKSAQQMSQKTPSCDVCGRHPNVIITTAFGRFCQEHAKLI